MGDSEAVLMAQPTSFVLLSPALVFAIPFGDLARCRSLRRSYVGVERDRLFVQTNHRLGGIVGLFIHRQNVFHLPDVLFVQFGHAPLFFPATASNRGFRARRELSLGPPWEPVFASPLARPPVLPSSVPGLPEDHYRP